MSDECLVNKALSGDTSAFEELAKRYYDLVRLLAFSILKDRHEAEDIAQEAFLKAYSRLRELRKPSSLFYMAQKDNPQPGDKSSQTDGTVQIHST